MNSHTDTELMLGVRDGRVADLAPLFERHNMRLFNHYLRLTGDRELSQDFVQEVFLRILKYRHTFRAESTFATWMFTIARNVQMDHIRKWHNEGPLPRRDDRDPPEPVSDEPVDHLYDTSLLRKALTRLSPEKREALILNRFEGMKYTEIAEFVGCSLDSVKVRIHRAMKDLRKIYVELSGEAAQ